jgi:hypothetical protein
MESYHVRTDAQNLTLGVTAPYVRFHGKSYAHNSMLKKLYTQLVVREKNIRTKYSSSSCAHKLYAQVCANQLYA